MTIDGEITAPGTRGIIRCLESVGALGNIGPGTIRQLMRYPSSESEML